jgi:putative glutamine amidotransferase
VQHLPTSARHVRRTDNCGAPAHLVEVESGTLLATITQEPTLDVNSRHHQAVARLGKGLRVCARDPEDGTVEAIDLPGRKYVLAVQWHPENQALMAPAQSRIFRTFIEAVTS